MPYHKYRYHRLSSHPPLKNARVLNMAANTIETLQYPEIRKLFDGKEAFKYCIIDYGVRTDMLCHVSRKVQLFCN